MTIKDKPASSFNRVLQNIDAATDVTAATAATDVTAATAAAAAAAAADKVTKSNIIRKERGIARDQKIECQSKIINICKRELIKSLKEVHDKYHSNMVSELLFEINSLD